MSNKKTITIRMSEDVHQKLKELAEKDHRTLSSFIEINLIKLIEK